MPDKKLIESTGNDRPSKYFYNERLNCVDLQNKAIELGSVVKGKEAGAFQKVYDTGREVGGSKGKPATHILIDVTEQGQVHSYPITAQEAEDKIKKFKK